MGPSDLDIVFVSNRLKFFFSLSKVRKMDVY